MVLVANDYMTSGIRPMASVHIRYQYPRSFYTCHTPLLVVSSCTAGGYVPCWYGSQWQGEHSEKCGGAETCMLHREPRGSQDGLLSN